jgi:hypothetical protein
MAGEAGKGNGMSDIQELQNTGGIMAKFDIEKDEEPNRMYVMVDDKFDVRIIRTDEGLIVDIYPYDGMEAFASTYAFDSDVESDEGAQAV